MASFVSAGRAAMCRHGRRTTDPAAGSACGRRSRLRSAAPAMMGDTVLFEDELPALDAALAAFGVTAIHNHLFSTRRTPFMHIGGHGDPVRSPAA
jgi:hypothetical protein